jgi:hypothetical protein
MAGKRYLFLIALSLCMAAHAVIIGRYLESVFFLTAFSWSWVGVTALRGNLAAARAMALTMIGLVLVASALLLSLGTQQNGLVATFSLAIIPGVVAWISVLFYISHLASGLEKDHAESESEFAVALDRWMTEPPDGSHFAEPVQPAVSSPLAAEAPTPEMVARIVGAIRATRPARDAA